MKKFLLGAVASIILMGSVAFKVVYDIKNSTAEVEQIEGYYIYVDSKPVKDFEYLGTVKGPTIGGSQYTEVRDVLIKRSKKEYPKADGLIMSFRSGQKDKCDAIRFK